MRLPKFRSLSCLDFYPLLRPFLFRLEPEKAHAFALKFLNHERQSDCASEDDPILRTNVCGMDFSNPIGLAAGFDKNAEVINQVLKLGFGFVELGGVTPEPQPGNPKPRLFRVKRARAVINRLGLNSEGIDVFVARIKAWRNRSNKCRGLIGANLGKNKDSLDDASDYITGLKKAAPYMDYIAINISSPNTPHLRDLQERMRLDGLLDQVMSAWKILDRKPPVFVKIAPDLTPQQELDIAEIALVKGVHGLIIGNTTIARPSSIPPKLAQEAGGLSGLPLFEPSTALLGRMYKLTGGKIPLIGCGGVSCGKEAYTKIRAGASLVQFYTALIYKGPCVVGRIKQDLANLLRRDGFSCVNEAVGSDQK